MKNKIILSILFVIFIPGISYSDNWQETFFNDIKSFYYEIAVENAVKSGIDIKDIAVFSMKLGYDQKYTSCNIQKSVEGLISKGDVKEDMGIVFSKLEAAGISESVYNDTSLCTPEKLNDLNTPSIIEVTMNYKRIFDNTSSVDNKKELVTDNKQTQKDNEEQGLGFGDDPVLGFGNLTLPQFTFSQSGNPTYISQSTP